MSFTEEGKSVTLYVTESKLRRDGCSNLLKWWYFPPNP